MCQSIHTTIGNFKIPGPKMYCDGCDREVEQKEIEQSNGFLLCKDCADRDHLERDLDW